MRARLRLARGERRKARQRAGFLQHRRDHGRRLGGVHENLGEQRGLEGRDAARIARRECRAQRPLVDLRRHEELITGGSERQ